MPGIPETPRRRVAVTAASCISPLGADESQTVASLRAAKDFVTPVTLFDVSTTRCKTAGQVPETSFERADARHPAAKKLSRVSRMMLATLGDAVQQCPAFLPERIIMGTTSGGMSLGEAFYRAFAGNKSLREARHWVREYIPQQAVLDAIAPFGWKAPYQIISNACASGTNSIGSAFQLVRAGLCQSVACGGYDAISELVFHGFDCLQASTPEKCRPFDANRTGLVLGEGAAVLFLEEWDYAVQQGRNILAEIIGYGSSTDNHHLTQPNPDGNGPRRAMQAALLSANIQPEQIDYINAHGTATPYNDASEGRAILDVCPTSKVSSTKSMMGHSLGAAGSIEAAFCICALRNGFVPANIHFQNCDETLPLDIVANTSLETNPNIILSNSFGFGGSNASLILKRVA
ncbi:MAG: beta-ketoacyl-[acyl-carrier-protein] synthase family protein [Chthoniobacterales bacterium]